MRRPISSNLSIFPPPELLARFRYYRNAPRASQGGELPLPYQWQWRIERWKNAVRGFFGGGNKQPRPKLCPSCGSLVGINVNRCHECGTNLTFSLAALSRKLSGLFGGTEAPVTTAMLIANVLMLGISWIAVTSEGGGEGLKILWGIGG